MGVYSVNVPGKCAVLAVALISFQDTAKLDSTVVEGYFWRIRCVTYRHNGRDKSFVDRLPLLSVFSGHPVLDHGGGGFLCRRAVMPEHLTG